MPHERQDHSTFSYFYHPLTKLREGYDFTGVCDSVHRGGGWGVPGSRGVPGPKGGCLVPGGQVWSWGVPGPGGGCLVLGVWSWEGAWSQGGYLLQRGLVWGGAWSRGCLVEDPPGMATAVGGMHPTGMHSCCLDFLLNLMNSIEL